MRVLIVALKFLPASGGSATYAHNLARGLREKGHTVRVLAPRYYRKHLDGDLNYEILRMPMTSELFRGIRIIFAAVQIWWQYVQFRPDVIWASSFGGCRAMGMLGFIRAPWIGTIHGGGIIRCRQCGQHFLNRWTLRMGKQFILQAKCIVTVSQEAKKLIRSLLPESFSRNDPRVIYNGIEYEPEKFVLKRDALSRHPEFNDMKVILTVGRLVKAKGHDITIHAIHRLSQTGKNIRYVIVGEGPEKKNLMSMAHDLDLGKQVIFTGYIGQAALEDYYALCDLFVMAGRETKEFIEGFGLVFVEASMRGKPVIGTRVGGIPEAIKDGWSGLIIEPDDPEILTQNIQSLLNDPARLKLFGENGRQWVHERFTTATMAKQNADLLSEIALTLQ